MGIRALINDIQDATHGARAHGCSAMPHVQAIQEDVARFHGHGYFRVIKALTKIGHFRCSDVETGLRCLAIVVKR